MDLRGWIILVEPVEESFKAEKGSMTMIKWRERGGMTLPYHHNRSQIPTEYPGNEQKHHER